VTMEMVGGKKYSPLANLTCTAAGPFVVQ